MDVQIIYYAATYQADLSLWNTVILNPRNYLSILGLLMFCIRTTTLSYIYINDLPLVSNVFNREMYADDENIILQYR